MSPKHTPKKLVQIHIWKLRQCQLLYDNNRAISTQEWLMIERHNRLTNGDG